ncbi:carboxypeptidase-like regulatory domain-containing protein [Winogradskyella ursingii]|uniref:carboxypeptidase-like regulatory domain-containing protein n=1 Tax=Winogradskyella ursingii TaxID=2686079 RepID=UPI0015CC4D5C|nr:carboxypeptidase-like regulatory domain-containing protein [Winogradskyella ursingii]
MKYTALLLFSLFTIITFGQDVQRTKVNGKIIVSSEDKEGVTVYNTSSNKGTVTDKNGNFEINVAVNDEVEFGALQFKNFTVTVTEQVVRTKTMTVILVEEVNKLDEVVLLPFGLTGNLNVDLDNVRTYNASLDAIYFGLNNIDDFEFSADYKSKPDNAAFREYQPEVRNMLDFVNLAKLFWSKKDKESDTELTEAEKAVPKTPVQEKIDTYGADYMATNFNVPTKQYGAFIDYVEAKGIDKTLLNNGNEVQFLERINNLSKEFLKNRGEKE